MKLGGRRIWETLVIKAVLDEILMGRDKCIKQLVLIAERNAKFRSSLEKASQFIAGTVFQKERLSNFLTRLNLFFSLFFKLF